MIGLEAEGDVDHALRKTPNSGEGMLFPVPHTMNPQTSEIIAISLGLREAVGAVGDTKKLEPPVAEKLLR